jgi:hypothetical protein
MSLVADEDADGSPSARQRDLLLLLIYVYVQHGYVERAETLSQALRALGDGSREARLAGAVTAFLRARWAACLDELDALDRIDPLERFGSYRLTERQRMRRYLRTRCLFELDDAAGARAALDGYLRHGEAPDEDAG